MELAGGGGLCVLYQATNTAPRRTAAAATQIQDKVPLRLIGSHCWVGSCFRVGTSFGLGADRCSTVAFPSSGGVNLTASSNERNSFTSLGLCSLSLASKRKTSASKPRQFANSGRNWLGG